MTVPTKDNTFTNGPGNKIDATQVNKNFDELYDTLNPAVIGIANDNVAAGAGIALSKLATIPSARVYHSGAQVITDSAETVLAFDSERYDNDVIHDTVTNNSRLTCKTAGVYQITATIGWQLAGLTNRRLVVLLVNGVTKIAADRRPANADSEQTVSTQYKLAVNDYVQVRVYQDSGGSVSVAAVPNFTPEFGMTWVSLG